MVKSCNDGQEPCDSCFAGSNFVYKENDIMNGLRKVKIKNVTFYDGKIGYFHGFFTRTYSDKKKGLLNEVVGVIELEDGKVIQLSINRFEFVKVDTDAKE